MATNAVDMYAAQINRTFAILAEAVAVDLARAGIAATTTARFGRSMREWYDADMERARSGSKFVNAAAAQFANAPCSDCGHARAAHLTVPSWWCTDIECLCAGFKRPSSSKEAK